MNVLKLVSDKLHRFSQMFSAEAYAAELGEEHRFPSLVSAAFRFVLKYILFAVPVIYIGMLVACLVKELPLLGALAAGLVFTALILAGVFLIFLLAMAVESFAKVFSCLILYGQLPKGAENPVDALITHVVRGEL